MHCICDLDDTEISLTYLSIKHVISSLIDLHKLPVIQWVATTYSSWGLFQKRGSQPLRMLLLLQTRRSTGALILQLK